MDTFVVGSFEFTFRLIVRLGGFFICTILYVMRTLNKYLYNIGMLNYNINQSNCKYIIML